jgi:hypothetical protein
MRRSPLNKTAKTKTQSFYRKKAVEIAKLIAKHRDGYACVNPDCSKTAEQGYQMHGSHILNENTHHKLSVEPENIMCQCAQHHMNWHGNPLMQAWFDETFPGRKEQLLKMDKDLFNALFKLDYKHILDVLRDKYSKMING